MPPKDTASSPRLLVPKFAAHLAMLLNSGTSHASLDPYKLDETMMRTLSSPGYQGLIGFALIGRSLTPSELARKYFEAVLERRLFLKASNHTHKGHELFLALCRRGLDPQWPGSDLKRRNVTDSSSRLPIDYPDVRDRLSRLPAGISAGNPAASTREKFGPLRLLVGSGNAEVVEELSIWQAITCAPRRMTVLHKGPAQKEFFSLVIRAVENANKAYGACLSIGLSPLDWDGELTVNTLKELSAFLTRAREVAGCDKSSCGNLDDWRTAWVTRPVPGYPTADELWHSELGRALRFPRVVSIVSNSDVELEQLADGEDDNAGLLDSAAIMEHLAAAHADNVIDDFDVWILSEIDQGATLVDLAKHPKSRLRFKGRTLNFATYVEDLLGRLLAYADKRRRETKG